MANFEVFTRKHTRPSGGPTVTLTKRGTLSLNRPAYEALGEPPIVQLLWDKERRIVGIRATTDAGDDGYAVNATNLMINASAFTRWVGLYTGMPANALRWDAYMEDDVLCIRLADEPTKVTSNRAKVA